MLNEYSVTSSSNGTYNLRADSPGDPQAQLGADNIPFMAKALLPGERVSFSSPQFTWAQSKMYYAYVGLLLSPTEITEDNFTSDYTSWVVIPNMFADLTAALSAEASYSAATFTPNPLFGGSGGITGYHATFPSFEKDVVWAFERSDDGKLLRMSIEDNDGTIYYRQYNLIQSGVDVGNPYVFAMTAPTPTWLRTPGERWLAKVKVSQQGNAHIAENPYNNFPDGGWHFYDNGLISDPAVNDGSSIRPTPGLVFTPDFQVGAPPLTLAQWPSAYAPLGKVNGEFGRHEYLFTIPAGLNTADRPFGVVVGYVPKMSGVSTSVNLGTAKGIARGSSYYGSGNFLKWATSGSGVSLRTLNSITWIRVESYGGIARVSAGDDEENVIYLNINLTESANNVPVVNIYGYPVESLAYEYSNEGTDFVTLPPSPIWEPSTSAIQEIALADPIWPQAGRLTFDPYVGSSPGTRPYAALTMRSGDVLEIDYTNHFTEDVQYVEVFAVPNNWNGNFDTEGFPSNFFKGLRIYAVDNSEGGGIMQVDNCGYYTYQTSIDVHDPSVGEMRVMVSLSPENLLNMALITKAGMMPLVADSGNYNNQPDPSGIFKVIVRSHDSTGGTHDYYLDTTGKIRIYQTWSIYNTFNEIDHIVDPEAEYWESDGWIFQYENLDVFDQDGVVRTRKGGFITGNLGFGADGQFMTLPTNADLGRFGILFSDNHSPEQQLYDVNTRKRGYAIEMRPDNALWNGALRPWYIEYGPDGQDFVTRRLADNVADMSQVRVGLGFVEGGLTFGVFHNDPELLSEGFDAALIELYPLAPLMIYKYIPGATTISFVYNDDVTEQPGDGATFIWYQLQMNTIEY